MRKILYIFVLIFLGLAGVFFEFKTQPKDLVAPAPKTVSKKSTVKSSPSLDPTLPPSTPTPTTLPSKSPLPPSAQITVPYTMQSPFNKWDPIHEDACEEASLIMVEHFLKGNSFGTLTEVNAEILALVNWESAHGYGPSLTLDQLNQVAKDYYGLANGSVVKITSVDQIKQEVAAGHPVILGMAGKILPNPYFSNGGPNYHMLVAKAYDATDIITNEPGTWHGDGFHYEYSKFYEAIHDWDASNILNGQKAFLVFR